MESVRTAFIYLVSFSPMLCQNHTSPVSWLDGAKHSYGLESARVLPPIKLVFLTLLLITDKSKSAPTCETQTSCTSAPPCLCGRRMFPSAWEESCNLSQLLSNVVLMAHYSMGWTQRAEPFPWCSAVRTFISFHHLFLREGSPPKIRESPNAKNICMEEKTHSTFLWCWGPAAFWW